MRRLLRLSGVQQREFGRIKCHEAINAYAQEILLTAKQQLEQGGWRVVHRIIDSIWVTPDPDVDEYGREDLRDIATDLTDTIGIRLEYEAEYDWVAFVPQRESNAGALTSTSGKSPVKKTTNCVVSKLGTAQRSRPQACR